MGCPQKEDPIEEVGQEAEFLVSEQDCLRALWVMVPLASSHLQWLGWVHPVAQQSPMHHPYGEGVTVEMHQGSSCTDVAKLVIENTSWKVWSPSWAILAHSCLCLLFILICLALYL